MSREAGMVANKANKEFIGGVLEATWLATHQHRPLLHKLPKMVLPNPKHLPPDIINPNS